MSTDASLLADQECEPVTRGAEVRSRVGLALAEQLQRDAAALRISVAELVRRILHAHYDERAREDEQILASIRRLGPVLEEARRERTLLVGMLDLIYQGLLLRLPRPAVDELDQRKTDAREGHERWKAELAQQLYEGGPEVLLALVGEAPPQEGTEP